MKAVKLTAPFSVLPLGKEAVETEHTTAVCGVSMEHSDNIGYAQMSALKFISKKEDAANPNEAPVAVTEKTKFAGIRTGSTLISEGGL